MPFETVVPAPPISYPFRASFPGGFQNRRSRENFRSFNDEARLAQEGVGNVTGSGGGETGATGSDFFDIRDGVACVWTTTSPRCTGWSFPWWTPYFDATGLAPGTRIPEGSVVAIIDAMYQTGFLAGAPADMMGVFIGGSIDGSSTGSYRSNTPGGANPGASTGGAGFLVDPAGTGFDWVTWGLGGAVANRIAVPAILTDWNAFRFVLTSGLPGGFANLQAFHNGVEIVNEPYGTATLPVPYAASGASVGAANTAAIAFTGMGVNPPTGWGYRFDAKFGRFLPSGQPIQGI